MIVVRIGDNLHLCSKSITLDYRFVFEQNRQSNYLHSQGNAPRSKTERHLCNRKAEDVEDGSVSKIERLCERLIMIKGRRGERWNQ